MLQLLYFIMGLVGLGGQVLILRRALVTFTGNEITISVLLAAWTAWTGIGSYVGGRLSQRWKDGWAAFNVLFIILYLSLPVTYIIIYLAKPIMGVGIAEAIGPFRTAAMTFIAVGPLCLTLGAMFPIAARLTDTGAGAATARVYIWEALGSGAGGIMASAAILPYFRPLAGAFALCAIGAAGMAGFSRGARRAGWIAATVAALALTIYPVFDNRLMSAIWAGYPVIEEKDSHYAHLALTQREGESTLFVDGAPTISWPGGAAEEEIAHMPMLAHPSPRRVLLIGGGLSTVGAEILKYPVTRLDYCEIDPDIIQMEKRVSAAVFTDARVAVHPVDGGRFLREVAPGSYDVIILDVGDPVTLAANRYYTSEMFALARRALSDPGIIAFATGQYANYLDPLLMRYLASIRDSLWASFDSVSIYPMESFVVIGGLGISLPTDAQFFTRALNERGVATRWFRPEIFTRNLSAERFSSVQVAIGKYSNTPPNEDYHPLGYAYWMAYWSTLFSESERDGVNQIMKARPWHGAVMLAAIFAIALATIRRRKSRGLNALVTCVGFTGMVLSVMVLYAAQVRLGTLFSLMGYFITTFMVGYSLGAYMMKRVNAGETNRVTSVCAIILIILTLSSVEFLSRGVAHVGDKAAIALLSLFALSASLLSGAVYAGAASLGEKLESRADRLSGGINSADLLGSAMGALFAGGIIFPLWGFGAALEMTAAVALAGLILRLAGKHRQVLR